MNTGIIKLAGILGVLALASACSSTRTQQSAGEVIDDSVLTSKVKVALIDDPVTKAGQINVETYRGVVQLGGHWSTAGYEFAASQAVDGNHFLGLALDQINQPILTEERLDAWLAKIKPELLP